MAEEPQLSQELVDYLESILEGFRLSVEHKKSTKFDFEPVFDFIKSRRDLKKFFPFGESPEETLSSFLEQDDEKINPDNYKALMKLAIATELYYEYFVADANSEPKYGLFANVSIEGNHVDFEYRIPDIAHPLRFNVGKPIEFTTTDDVKLETVVEDITETSLILKAVNMKKEQKRLYNGEVPLKKTYYKPNDCTAFRLLYGIDSLKGKELMVLFPTHKQPDYQKPCLMPLVEKNVGKLNAEQIRVIKRILEGSSPHPFILFGPPGTGKTTTICNLIKELYNRLSYGKVIVVAASSNTAIDVIVKNLIGMKFIQETNDIVRLVSLAYDRSLDRKIRPYAILDSDEVVDLKNNGKLKILCGTLQVLGKLSKDENIKATHVIVDEAGQSTTAEISIVWPRMLEKRGQLILAGDPHQLGPTIMCEGAKYLGLEQSMLQRLMSYDIYNIEHEEHEKHVIQLVKNYRSVQELIDVPNQLFYHGKLQAMNRTKMMTCYCIFKTVCPLVFIPVYTPHGTEEENMSLRNNGQIVALMKCLGDLFSYGVKKNDIGIITPYCLQLNVIRNALRRNNWISRPHLFQNGVSNGITVGTVDAFQGNERKIIILSTVRSSLTTDSLGFLSHHHYQRFNVAVTRAKELLIVIGDPSLLNRDKNWRTLIDYTKENLSYIRNYLK